MDTQEWMQSEMRRDLLILRNQALGFGKKYGLKALFAFVIAIGKEIQFRVGTSAEGGTL